MQHATLYFIIFIICSPPPPPVKYTTVFLVCFVVYNIYMLILINAVLNHQIFSFSLAFAECAHALRLCSSFLNIVVPTLYTCVMLFFSQWIERLMLICFSNSKISCECAFKRFGWVDGCVPFKIIKKLVYD